MIAFTVERKVIRVLVGQPSCRYLYSSQEDTVLAMNGSIIIKVAGHYLAEVEVDDQQAQ
jgi:hypothetical protein